MAAAISEDVANRLSFAGSEAYTVIGHSLDASSSSNKMDLSSQNSYVKDGVLYCNHCTRGQGLMNEEKEIWPPSHPRRTLVLCFDGTGDQFDSDNSNVVELIKILKKDDISKQMVYYQAGIGTYTIPQIATPLMAAFDKKVDEAVAWHINSHVMGGYEFLMQNYNHGDRICLFGFSRGAYIARSLGGMLHKVGLLPPCNHQQVPFAYKMYTTVDETGWKQANAFKKAFSMDVDVEFLGVWDTVSSVGLIPRYLPFPTSNTFIRTFRHAVSLDERRAKFKANLWNRPTAKELALSDFDSDNPRNKMGAVYDENNQIPDEEIDYVKDRNSPTDIKEVWFAGCHCDVGGGSGNAFSAAISSSPEQATFLFSFERDNGEPSSHSVEMDDQRMLPP
ncbi:hypothetical protein AMATHDRAFT_6303 [Amanita thiersii Skay4041]|uniref:T6SS Phospholipase effector Tle1-like catalytic domain-containing protein n=1 Tax=Amanita thiersii Skay4041 TaxID=703135 RepID=A0A2A9NI01_9AGAR|nr:hypothetical protein AMATHDRAFT_6303 [Amanita thiersii Skay4041]